MSTKPTTSTEQDLIGKIVRDTSVSPAPRYAIGTGGFLCLDSGQYLPYDSAFPGPVFFTSPAFEIEAPAPAPIPALCWSCAEDGYETIADTSDDNGPLCEGCHQRRVEDGLIDADVEETPEADIATAVIEATVEQHTFRTWTTSRTTRRGGISTHHAGCTCDESIEFGWYEREGEHRTHLYAALFAAGAASTNQGR